MTPADLDALAALKAEVENVARDIDAILGPSWPPNDIPGTVGACICTSLAAISDRAKLALREPPPAGGERTCENCRWKHPEYQDVCTNDALKGNWLSCRDLGNFCGSFAPRVEGR